jgi:hypothetical protein
LYNVSLQFNNGTQTLRPLGKMQEVSTKSFEEINRSTIIIEEKMKNLNYIRNAMDLVRLPSSEKLINK